MDYWISNRFSHDYRVMRRSGKDWHWWGCTMLAIGFIPIILSWALSQVPPGSTVVGLATAIPSWAVFTGIALADLGFVLVLAGWYVRSLSKRLERSL